MTTSKRKPFRQTLIACNMQTRIGYTRADQLILEADEPGRNRWKTWIEILVTSVIIAVIWGLLSLPSVFYFLPAQSWENETRRVRILG